VPRRRALSLSESLTPSLLGRETVQLSVLAVLSGIALWIAPRWLTVVAGVVDALLVVACAVGVSVAARQPRRPRALAVYGAALVIFALLAAGNLRG
jgi:hypothetical protein